MRERWDERYRSKDLVWGTDANRFVAEAFKGVAPRGRALDLACGEGRNAIWLATQGWEVTGVDFSLVAIERATQLASSARVDVDWAVCDVTEYDVSPGAHALVLVSYLQVPKTDFSRALRHAAAALEAGGELFMIGHALKNLTEGVGGPQDADVLWDPDWLREELTELGLRVDRCENVLRPVAQEEGTRDAVDVLVRATLSR